MSFDCDSASLDANFLADLFHLFDLVESNSIDKSSSGLQEDMYGRRMSESFLERSSTVTQVDTASLTKLVWKS